MALQESLRQVKFLEMMTEEQISQLADAMQLTTHSAGSVVIEKGTAPKDAFFVLVSGECMVTAGTGDEAQEYRRYHTGDFFGELAPMRKANYAAFVIATIGVQVAHVSIENFESMFGPTTEWQETHYKTDPRKVISEFFEQGDKHGPRGVLRIRSLEPDPTTASSWFAVFNCTSRDSIAKMLSGVGTGKKYGVHGRAAEKGCLSGFVPFVQINSNDHKAHIEVPTPDARVIIFYKSQESREKVAVALTSVIEEAELDIDIADKSVHTIDDYLPKHFGLDLPKALFYEVYIKRQDLVPAAGWETGLVSDPFMMNMNLRSVGDASEPEIVLLQHDEAKPMNANSLLLAQRGDSVTAMTQAFDVVTIGSKGVTYEPLPEDQVEKALWALDRSAEILKTPDHNPWTNRWQQILKSADKGDLHQQMCESRIMGDATSSGILADLVDAAAETKAVSGRADCWNFWCPYELSSEFLVVWEGFKDKPWEYMAQPTLQQFLIERAGEDFVFPVNPVWPAVDTSWAKVFGTVKEMDGMKKALQCWFPPTSGILERISVLTEEHPEGFKILGTDGHA